MMWARIGVWPALLPDMREVMRGFIFGKINLGSGNHARVAFSRKQSSRSDGEGKSNAAARDVVIAAPDRLKKSRR